MRGKKLIPLLIVLLLPVAAVAFTGPGPGPERGCGPGKRNGAGPAALEDGEREERQLLRLSRLLKLNDSQREKVGAILAAEAEKAQPLLEQLAETGERLHQMVHSGTADEAAVRELAAKQGKTKADLLVLRAQSWQKIHPLLTPEQQEAAKNAPVGPRAKRAERGGGRN